MKLIIDIPEETKQAFDKAEATDLKGGYYDHGGIIGKAIQNGTPLDSVKAEIQKKYRDAEFMNEFVDGCNHTIGEVLEILDSVSKEE